MSKWNSKQIAKLFELRTQGYTWAELTTFFPEETANSLRKTYYRNMRKESDIPDDKLKVLVFDIETSPLLVYAWGLFQQNISLDMVVEDTSIISWSAKWVGSDEVMYMDVRGQKNLRNDKKIVMGLYKLLDEADMVITQNGKSFDVKVLNARLVKYDIDPPSSFDNIDTLTIARKHFKFTSNKLAYMTGNLCTEHVKSGHKKFPGFSLWAQCMKDNKEAWDEMAEYNKMDVLSLEELYLKRLKKWDNSKAGKRFKTGKK